MLNYDPDTTRIDLDLYDDMEYDIFGRIMDSNTLNYRYAALAQLWEHQNTTQLQWPVVIIGVVLVGLATLSAALLSTLTVATNWGSNPSVRTLGVCFLLAGTATAIMCHTMSRARIIMRRTERELHLIEEQLGVGSPLMRFGDLNHPPGISGPLLLRLFVALAVCAPINALAFLFLFGLNTGSAMSVVVLAWLVFDLRTIRESHGRG
jgi:hypothetical protein